MANAEALSSVVEVLKEVDEDMSVPKNVKLKIKSIMDDLAKGGEDSMKISRALQELEQIADDINIQPYTRTQIWNVVSILEKV